MKLGMRVASLALGTLLQACAPAAPPAPVAPVSPPEPATQPQASYCERLQPLLSRAGASARIGAEMACLDIPGVTELGRYGAANAGEEGAIADCFDDPQQYAELLERSASDFELSIDSAFIQDSRAGVGASLSTLVPWLPRLEMDTRNTRRVSARVALTHARFVTVLGLATKLQGQRREQECLEALCKPGYSYVHKALIGVPSLLVTAEDAHGHHVDLGASVVSSSFAAKDLAYGSRAITSKQPMTLAIARSAFRTAQTERLCQACGRKNQRCCVDGPACDGGLGCFEQQCVAVGGPDQPCDGPSCSVGACVGGKCRSACGGVGQPCCSGDACSGALRCNTDPESELEPRVSVDEVKVDGGWLGTSEDRAYGTSTCGALRTRGRFAVTKVGAGRGGCEKAWWFDPSNQKDCRVISHFEVSPFGSIECRIEVFAAPASRPKLCQP